MRRVAHYVLVAPGRSMDVARCAALIVSRIARSVARQVLVAHWCSMDDVHAPPGPGNIHRASVGNENVVHNAAHASLRG